MKIIQIISMLTIYAATSYAATSYAATKQVQTTLATPPLSHPSLGKTYTLKNSIVTVTIAPDIGRITHFSFIDGRNLIWLNDMTKIARDKSAGASWLNWGGDKVWPAQQADWKFIYGSNEWPPKTELDGTKFTVIEATDKKLIMESPVDNALHIKLRRTLILEKTSPKLTIKNRLTRTAPSPWPVHIWSVTQCIPPNYTLLGISKDAPDYATRPFSNLWNSPLPHENTKVQDNTLIFSLAPNLSIAKAGTIGNLCAAVYDEAIFLQQSDAPANACYPDGANIEVFSFDRYTELEILSPNIHLKNDKSITSVTTWTLIKNAPSASVLETLKTVIKRTSKIITQPIYSINSKTISTALTADKQQPQNKQNLTLENKHALALGYKVIATQEALKHPEKKSSKAAIIALGSR